MIGKFAALAIALLSWASVAASAQTVVLTWVQSPSPSVVSNVVYRAPIWKGPYIAIFGSTEPITGYTDAGVALNETYCYFVTAVDASGAESSRSNKVCRTPHEKNAPIINAAIIADKPVDGDEQ